MAKRNGIHGVSEGTGSRPRGRRLRFPEERRFLLRAELDAAFFHLYLPADPSGDWVKAESETDEDLKRLKASFAKPRDAVDYIMDTFPIVKRKDEERYGSYRTKEMILTIHDEMQEAIRSDQGSDFTGRALDQLAYERRIELWLIEAGKPTQNAYIESFNGEFRDECLNGHWFRSLPEARAAIAVWQQDLQRAATPQYRHLPVAGGLCRPLASSPSGRQ